jgi:hypothetical protein
MALIVDQDISGEGEYTFSPVALVSGLVNLTSLGPKTTVYGTGSTRRVNNAGYFALGYNFADARSTTESWYHAPMWIPFEHWTFLPYYFTGGIFAERVKWHLTPGTSGYLLLFS